MYQDTHIYREQATLTPKFALVSGLFGTQRPNAFIINTPAVLQHCIKYFYDGHYKTPFMRNKVARRQKVFSRPLTIICPE